MAKGDAVIPMSTDISTAALIAAAIESIDKVGPFQAKFNLMGIDDIRAIKKKIIVDRAAKAERDGHALGIADADGSRQTLRVPRLPPEQHEDELERRVDRDSLANELTGSNFNMEQGGTYGRREKQRSKSR